MLKRSKFIIATTSRFHVLNLASELIAIGHEVEFFSVIPKFRAKKFGLPVSNLRSLFWYTFPFLILEKLFKGRTRQKIQRLLAVYCDFLVQRKLSKCDFFIGMSGMFSASQSHAKLHFNAVTICERGSTHALHQISVLKSLQSSETSLEATIAAELSDYICYDKISIPSKQVATTFLEKGIAESKLIINPYGVDLTSFKPFISTDRPEKRTNGIFVGRWGLRKGADIIQKIVEYSDITISHVGPVDDFPIDIDNPRFMSFGAIDQQLLPKYYNAADFALLLSREEGLALVQAQALACGLPLLCSQFTGGQDLKSLIAVPQAIVEVDIYNFDSVLEGLQHIKELAKNLKGHDLIGESGRKNLTWRAYAKRYVGQLCD
jgi:alpha-maltose-1-phosphate synthase